jgi:predicted DNA-binding ribbon-helix-helix protein
MKSPVIKRSIVVAGHKTSVSLEDAFWNGLKEIASRRQVNLSNLVASIDSQRQHGNLSSALRLFVLEFIAYPTHMIATYFTRRWLVPVCVLEQEWRRPSKGEPLADDYSC